MFVKRVLLLKCSFSGFKLLSKRRELPSAQEAKCYPHSDAGALPRQSRVQQDPRHCSLLRMVPSIHALLSPKGSKTPCSQGLSPHFWGVGPDHALPPAQLCAGSSRLQVPLDTDEATSWEMRALLIQKSVIVAVCPWFLGNRASHCVCCFDKVP